MGSNANDAGIGASQHYQNGANPVAPPEYPQWVSFSRNTALTTEAMAAALGVRAQSIRKRYSAMGTYFGLRPIKLPNRRLIWDAATVEKFLRGEVI